MLESKKVDQSNSNFSNPLFLDLIKLFAGVFNGQELGVEDLSEFERIIDDQPITKAQLTRNAPEEESKSERDFRIDCVDFSRSQYLITK